MPNPRVHAHLHARAKVGFLLPYTAPAAHGGFVLADLRGTEDFLGVDRLPGVELVPRLECALPLGVARVANTGCLPVVHVRPLRWMSARLRGRRRGLSLIRPHAGTFARLQRARPRGGTPARPRGFVPAKVGEAEVDLVRVVDEDVPADPGGHRASV